MLRFDKMLLKGFYFRVHWLSMVLYMYILSKPDDTGDGNLDGYILRKRETWTSMKMVVVVVFHRFSPLMSRVCCCKVLGV